MAAEHVKYELLVLYLAKTLLASDRRVGGE